MDSVTQPPHGPGPLTREAALDAIALAAALLFAHGQTTERTIVAAARLGRALGLSVTTLPYWGQLTVEIDGTTLSKIVPVKPLGVDFGVADATTLLLVAMSATIGALARRSLASVGGNPFTQPLCAAAIAGAVAGAAGRLQLSEAITLIAFCPCMVLVPGPHLLNGAIDLARTRIALGIARLAYAGVFVLMICAGLWFGLVATGATLPAAGSPAPTPLTADVIAAGCAVAAFGTFFSMPWRLLPFPIVVGMFAHAVRWAVISMSSANAATGAFVACIIVSVIVTPVANRLHLPFAALGFSAVVSMMPGFFLFLAASALVELVSVGRTR